MVDVNGYFYSSFMYLRKFVKILTRTLLALLMLLLLLYALLHFSPVQTWLVKQVTTQLSAKLKTRVHINRVDFSFFDKMQIEGVLVEDHAKDTLLYAGVAEVKLTDWFFLKDKITLHYIGLEDATIHLNRKEINWNYQFLIDYFGNDTSNVKTRSKFVFDFREVHLKRVKFLQTDQWVGKDMEVFTDKADFEIQEADLAHQKLLIRSASVYRPFVAISNYDGKRPANYQKPVTNVAQKNTEALGWTIIANQIMIHEGVFEHDNITGRDPLPGYFDGDHLLFTAIRANLNAVKFSGDSLTSLVDLSTMERSGLLVKKLFAKATITGEQMEFAQLDLETNESHLKDYFAMRYDSFNYDMNRFISNVQMEARFKNSVLSSNDLSFFDPSLKSWNRKFYFSGDAKGTVDHFAASNLQLVSGNTSITGAVDMRGLPDINSTFIDIRSKELQTDYTEIASFIPSLKNITQPNLRLLGKISWQGHFTGFLDDFVAFGTVKTDLGTLNADLNMKLPATGKPQYTGKLQTMDFNLGLLTNNKQIGNITLDGKIKGTGFTLKDLNADFEGTIQKLDFNGYRYQQIFANGNFVNNRFTGHLTIDDPNLQIRNMDGTLSLLGDEIDFNLNADLKYANLKEINLSKEQLNLSGLFSLNFTGNNIDNFLGTARIYDASLNHDSVHLSFDSLTLKSTIQNNQKQLSLQSNEIDAVLTGSFRIVELPDAFRVFLANYYPAYITPPKRSLSNQDFSFHIQTKEAEAYFQLLDKKISGFNNSSLSGRLDLAGSALEVKANVPYFGYDGKTFTNTILNGNGNRDTLTTSIRVDDIAINDSLHFPATSLQLISNNDLSAIQLRSSVGNALNQAELNANVKTYSDGVKIHFFPSSFILNNQKWLIEKDGELTFRKNLLDANEIRLVHDDQRISFATEMDDITDQTHVVAKLEKLNLVDFLPFVLKDPELKGALTGTATIRDPFGKLSIDFMGNADSLTMNDKYVGNVMIKGSANTFTGMIKYEAESKDTTNSFSLKGTYHINDSSDRQLDANLNAEHLNLSILEPYLGAVFSEMEGDVATNLKLSGNSEHQYLTGKVDIRDAVVKVGYTQCRYWISDQSLTLQNDLIDLGLIRLKDSMARTATISGKIRHRLFDQLLFENIKLETGKLALMNTTKYDNNQFYGNITGRAKLSINGPLTNLLMTIDGEPSILDSSHIYLPTTSGKESNQVDYIDFIQYGSEMAEQRISAGTNIIVNLNVKANPACKVDVILDEETGDILKGQGNGLISIRVGNNEPLSMRGNYELTKGEYTFNFQTFFKKPFTLNKGNITWNGDPYEAIISIDAEYLAKNVDISGLSTSGGFKQKEDITIIAHLTGVLQKPYVQFEFLLPERSEARRDDIIVKRLADFKNDENEMNKQVASLLLFNTFIIGNQNFLTEGGGGSLFTSITSTIGGMISSLLTNFFNRELERATNGVLSTYIDINPTLDLQKSAAQLQANVRAGLKILFSNRLIMLVGGNLDYNNSTYAQQLDRRGLVTPDITIEWLINKDGTLRVVGFNRSSIDFTLNQRNRSGLQLTYRKDVNKVIDIFKSKRKLLAEEKKTDLPIITTISP